MDGFKILVCVANKEEGDNYKEILVPMLDEVFKGSDKYKGIAITNNSGGAVRQIKANPCYHVIFTSGFAKSNGILAVSNIMKECRDIIESSVILTDDNEAFNESLNEEGIKNLLSEKSLSSEALYHALNTETNRISNIPKSDVNTEAEVANNIVEPEDFENEAPVAIEDESSEEKAEAEKSEKKMSGLDFLKNLGKKKKEKSEADYLADAMNNNDGSIFAQATNEATSEEKNVPYIDTEQDEEMQKQIDVISGVSKTLGCASNEEPTEKAEDVPPANVDVEEADFPENRDDSMERFMGLIKERDERLESQNSDMPVDSKEESLRTKTNGEINVVGEAYPEPDLYKEYYELNKEIEQLTEKKKEVTYKIEQL